MRSSDEVVPLIPSDCWLKNSAGPKTIEEEEMKLTRQALNNPLVPLGMLATTGCLIGMCYSTFKRDRMKAQYYMRGRVVAQFFTFCMLVGGAWYIDSRRNNGNGQIPPKPPTDVVSKFFLGDRTSVKLPPSTS